MNEKCNLSSAMTIFTTSYYVLFFEVAQEDDGSQGFVHEEGYKDTVNDFNEMLIDSPLPRSWLSH